MKFQFKCECVACVNDYPFYPNLNYEKVGTGFGSVKKMIEGMKKNFEHITKNIKSHPTENNCRHILRNKALLVVLSGKVYLPLYLSELLKMIH
jgi:hypothetical protein